MLKQKELCNKLIKENLVKPYDVIKHSYSQNRMNSINSLRIENKSNHKLCPCISTRADMYGVVVYG